MGFWTQGGKIVVDAEGRPIDCDHCPCDDGEGECCCVQLGTSGTFEACGTGTLWLLINDDDYTDNGTGTITVTITPPVGPPEVFNLDSTGPYDTGMELTDGLTYTYSATGTAEISTSDPFDPSLFDLDGNHLSGFDPTGLHDPEALPCVGFTVYSLVGKICPEGVTP